jgi:hypothetical protein
LVLELISHLAHIFWEALDRINYAVGVVRCWAVDLIYRPVTPTPADGEREADHERLIASLEFSVELSALKGWPPDEGFR